MAARARVSSGLVLVLVVELELELGLGLMHVLVHMLICADNSPVCFCFASHHTRHAPHRAVAFGESDEELVLYEHVQRLNGQI